MTWAGVIYASCALTSFACAFLLWRGYGRTRVRLLFWSALCFTGLFVNNALLVLDARIAQDLSALRSLPAVLGVAALLYGLIWETER